MGDQAAEATAQTKAHTMQPSMFETAEASLAPQGLTLMAAFLTAEQEQWLAAWVDKQEWNGELSRRVQHYGWKYDYRAKRIDKSMKIGEIPPWAKTLGGRLVDAGLLLSIVGALAPPIFGVMAPL